MLHRFGPWSSALGDVQSPHLSTFWKRRLALLGTARRASPTLSRRDSLKLVAAGAAAWALPTFHLASADGPDVVKPPAAGRIYALAFFKNGPDGEAEDKGIFAIDPETAMPSKVGDFEGNAIRVSPDGRTLALSRAGWTGNLMHEIDNVGLWTLDSEGKGEKRRIADFGGTVSWSPDSKSLCYEITYEKIVDKDGKRIDGVSAKPRLWIIDAEGANRHPLNSPRVQWINGLDWR